MSDKQGWTGGPQSRGTFDIFWTCISTLALCVWSAVHPNILLVPNSKRSLLTRLGMMMVAIVFPEIIISSAWRQLRSSQWLRNEINCLHLNGYNDYSKKHKPARGHSYRQMPRVDNDQGSQRSLLPTFEFETMSEDIAFSPSTPKSTSGVKVESMEGTFQGDEVGKKLPLWNSEQAFFAVMGGFAVENDYLTESDTKITIRRLVTVDGVLQLAKLGLIPTIDPEDISERSKADNIAKIFVLSQITWFALQVIGRLASDLPVTPLELHAAIHVACTMIIYLLWMKKPYDLRGSITLTDPDAKAVGAVCNFYRIASELHAQACADYEKARIKYWEDRVVRAANNLSDHDPPPNPPVRELLTKAIERHASSSEGEQMIPRNTQEHILIALAPLAKQGIDILRKSGRFSDDSINWQSWDLLRGNSENFVIKAVWGGWSTNKGHEMSLDKGVHFLFNFLYGGGHLAAWASSSFPTSTEHWLWITSSLVLTCVPLLGTLWILWWRAVNSKQKWLYPIRNGDMDFIAAPFFFVVMLAYFLARCYFLIESLISLRLLPVGAFLTVNWARYLPHVG